MSWWIPAAGAVLQGVSSFMGEKGKRHRGRNLASKLENLANVTESERDYIKKQRQIAEGGDPFQNQMMQEQMNRVGGNIRQTGAENMQRTEGSIIRQGMESSIVAAELRRKTADTTLRNVAEQSRRIAAENRFAQERTKREAEERGFRMQMGIEARERGADREAAYIRSKLPSRSEMNWGLIGNLAGAGMQGYGDFKAHSPWAGIDTGTFDEMDDLSRTAFLKSLTSEQQLRFLEHIE